MREIKFRLFDKERNEMILNPFVYFEKKFDLNAPCGCTLDARPIAEKAWQVLREWKIVGKE